MTDSKSHWERTYTTKAPGEESWFQPAPGTSLRLIEAAGVQPGT